MVEYTAQASEVVERDPDENGLVAAMGTIVVRPGIKNIYEHFYTVVLAGSPSVSLFPVVSPDDASTVFLAESRRAGGVARQRNDIILVAGRIARLLNTGMAVQIMDENPFYEPPQPLGPPLPHKRPGHLYGTPRRNAR